MRYCGLWRRGGAGRASTWPCFASRPSKTNVVLESSKEVKKATFGSPGDRLGINIHVLGEARDGCTTTHPPPQGFDTQLRAKDLPKPTGLAKPPSAAAPVHSGVVGRGVLAWGGRRGGAGDACWQLSLICLFSKFWSYLSEDRGRRQRRMYTSTTANVWLGAGVLRGRLVLTPTHTPTPGP